MPSLKSTISAFCFCLLMAWCAISAKADTTYTYMGAPFFEFGAASCPPTCNITGSFTLATPLPANANATISTFAFNAGPFIFTSLTNGPFGVSTNAAGMIDAWSIDMIEELSGGGVAEISSGAPTFNDELEFGADDGLGDGGLKFFFGADAGGIGFWTASTSTGSAGVPEPGSGALLIAGLGGLAGLALKRFV